MSRKLRLAGSAAGLALLAVTPAQAAPHPWMNAKLSPDVRAAMVEKEMTLDEKIGLLHGEFPIFMAKRPPDVQASAGYYPPIARLGIPALTESDASLGVANARRANDQATPLPSGLAIASTWNLGLARAGGAMIGKQARQKGFNILLAGGANLERDPFNGRNFEYLGEDPLLAGSLAGAAIQGIQGQHVLSTAKHFALNAQETGRHVLNARIEEAALRESDLLAFEIAIETGDPGSVMCAYNRVNGPYACANPHLLTDVLRTDWGWKGWVMSDWGAVPSLDAAMTGLDQQSGAALDKAVYFDKPLREALASGAFPKARFDDMVHRILRGLFAKGLVDHPLQPATLDLKADDAVAQRVAEEGIVLLKNEGGLLPLSATAKTIAVIGAHADVGVLSGGGSSQVLPEGSLTLPRPKDVPDWAGGPVFHPSSPLAAIRARAKGAEVVYDPGTDVAAAVAVARKADVVVLFLAQWSTEGRDTPMRFDDGQDALAEALLTANPNTVVVLETGNPLLLPWADRAKTLVEAWYPGAKGGEAIARVLYGEVNPSGRLPVSFAASLDQLPRAEPPGKEAGQSSTAPSYDVDYVEGSSVGYRWFAQKGRRPLFAFGHGLSYTSFRYGGLKVAGGTTLTASFTVTNTGNRAGIDTPQVYLKSGPKRAQQRLLGWSRVALKPGETRTVTVRADRRLLANWDTPANRWRLDGGRYQVFLASDAQSPKASGAAVVKAATLKP